MPSYTYYSRNRNFLMTKLLVVFAASLVLASISEYNTKAMRASGRRYSAWRDWAYILLAVILILFTGLRTGYNDTMNYFNGFRNAPELAEWISDKENWNPFKNPLFSFYQSFLKTYTNNPQLLIFSLSMLNQICLLRFFKRYSTHFTFSIFIYFTLGTFVFSLAALKQITAMAICTLAFPYLEVKKWGRYFFLILIATLMHTYAMAFAAIPLFRARPWSLFTFVFITVVAAVMMNFETAITAFMEQANDLGKNLADYEVFDDATINVFRLTVYAVPPLLSFFFQKWVLRDCSRMDHVMVHMGIISFAFMCMGTQAGANMFGRMGNYFELGTICCLPWMLEKTFDKRSFRLVSGIACACFMGFFVYANAIHGSFDWEYQAISIFKFIRDLF